MKIRFLGVLSIILCILTHLYPSYLIAASKPEWRLDYTSGDGVLVDASNTELERQPFKSVLNLRVSPTNPNLVIGDLFYIGKNNRPFTLMFQSNLETKKTTQLDDTLSLLRVFLNRYCCFAGKVYHLPSETISITPYSSIQISTKPVNINVNEDQLSVTFTEEALFRRSFDRSEYLRSKQVTLPIQRTLLGYTYFDDQQLCYPQYHLQAIYCGYELVNKITTSARSIPYKLISLLKIDQSTVEHLGPDRVSVSVTEDWFRPGTKHLIELTRRVELLVETKCSFVHNDANLRSVKSIISYVEYNSNTLQLSERTETVPYEACQTPHSRPTFRSFDEANLLDVTDIYKRPDGTIYKKSTIEIVDEDGFVLL